MNSDDLFNSIVKITKQKIKEKYHQCVENNPYDYHANCKKIEFYLSEEHSPRKLLIISWTHELIRDNIKVDEKKLEVAM